MIGFAQESGMSLSEHFRSYDDAVNLLLKYVPIVSAQISGMLDASAWEAMRVRYNSFKAFKVRGVAPPLVATFLGPSGSGKSTLFRWLTGIDVPVSVRRPTTYQCVLAVPPSHCDEELLSLVFPGKPLVRLQHPDDVSKKPCGIPKLFYAPMNAKTRGLPFILADVPDFNTVERENWARAHEMLTRAELTIFVCYKESYKDERTIEMLAHCCRLSERLVYVLTKTDQGEAEAREIKDDLLRTVKGLNGFQGVRSDGRKLTSFLADSLWYYSPLVLSDPISQIAVRPLEAHQPDFFDLLRGQPSEKLIIGALANSASTAVPYCREVLRNGLEKLKRCQAHIHSVEKALCAKTLEAVKKVYQLEIFIKELERINSQQAPALWKRVLRKLRELMTNLVCNILNIPWRLAPTKLQNSLGNVLRRASSKQSGTGKAANSSGSNVAMSLSEDLIQKERNQISKMLNELIDELRRHFRSDAGDQPCVFSPERCRAALNAAFEDTWPTLSRQWTTYLSQRIEASTKLWRRLELIIDGAVALCAVLLVACTVSRALFGVLPKLPIAVGIAFIASLIVGKLTADCRRRARKKLAEQAHGDWCEGRSGELLRYLKTHFAQSLLDSCWKTCQALGGVPFEQLQRACDQIDELARRSRDSKTWLSSGIKQ